MATPWHSRVMAPPHNWTQLATPRIRLIAGGTLYLYALWWVFGAVISPTYGYDGHIIRPLWITQIVTSWSLAVLPLLYLPSRMLRPSQVILLSLYIMVYAPTQLFIPHYLTRDVGEIIAFQLALAGCFALLNATYWLKPLELPIPRVSSGIYWLCVTGLTLLLLATLQFTVGLRLQMVSLLEVYTLREQFKVEATRLVNYAFAWLGNLVAPFLIAEGLARRKATLIAAAILLQLIMFSLAGSKAFLFGVGFVLAVYLACLGDPRQLPWRYVGMVGLGVFVGGWIDVFMGSFLVSGFGTLRGVIVPGQLTSYYFDYFSNHPWAQLGDGTLKGLMPYPYDLPVPNLIAREYFGDPNIVANANIWADGYANFGYLGMLIATLILGLTLMLLDAVSKGLSLRFVALALIMPAVSIANSAMLTSLLTQGVGLLIVLLYFHPRPGAEAKATGET